jgi:hypothetical protein
VHQGPLFPWVYFFCYQYLVAINVFPLDLLWSIWPNAKPGTNTCVSVISVVGTMVLHLVDIYNVETESYGAMMFDLGVIGLMLNIPQKCVSVISVPGIMVSKLIDIYNFEYESCGIVLFDLGYGLLHSDYYNELLWYYTAMCHLMHLLWVTLISSILENCSRQDPLEQRHGISILFSRGFLRNCVSATKSCMLAIWFPCSYLIIFFNGSNSYQQ